MYVDKWCLLYFFHLFSDFFISKMSGFLFIHLGDSIKWQDLCITALFWFSTFGLLIMMLFLLMNKIFTGRSCPGVLKSLFKTIIKWCLYSYIVWRNLDKPSAKSRIKMLHWTFKLGMLASVNVSSKKAANDKVTIHKLWKTFSLGVYVVFSLHLSSLRWSEEVPTLNTFHNPLI